MLDRTKNAITNANMNVITNAVTNAITNAMTTRARADGRVALLAALLALAGCAADIGAEDDVGVNTQAIWNGTPIPELNSGVVNVGGGCSGTLLRNQWVLTAAHCVNLHLDRDFSAAPGGQHIGSRQNVTITSAAADSSGRLLVGGWVLLNNTNQLYMARYTSAGVLDTGFGVGGEVAFDFAGSTGEGINALAIMSDGRIVAAGWATVNNSTVVGVARFAGNGGPDLGFGFFGATHNDIPGSSAEQAFGVTVDSAGRPVIVGTATSSTPGDYRILVARLTALNGAGDATFASGAGYVITDVGAGTESGYAVTNDGTSIVVAGRTATAGVVVRYTSAGAVDPAFGKRVISSARHFSSVLMQGTKILAGGSTTLSEAAVYRLTSTGVLDSGTFGISGVAKPRIGGPTSTHVVGLALAADGRIRVGLGTNEPVVGHAALSANGALTNDPITFENTALRVGVGQGAAARAMAVSGTRVFIVGEYKPGSVPSEFFMVLQPDRKQDTTFNGFQVTMNGESQWADRAYYSTSNDDTTLLHLANGMLMNGSRTGYQFPGFVTNHAALVNTDLLCRGYGHSTILPNDGGLSGFGTLRSGTIRVRSLDPLHVNMGARPLPAAQQSLLPGDSGSSCATTAGRLIGPLSRGGSDAENKPTGSFIRADRIATWATQLIATN